MIVFTIKLIDRGYIDLFRHRYCDATLNAFVTRLCLTRGSLYANFYTFLLLEITIISPESDLADLGP